MQNDFYKYVLENLDDDVFIITDKNGETVYCSKDVDPLTFQKDATGRYLQDRSSSKWYALKVRNFQGNSSLFPFLKDETYTLKKYVLATDFRMKEMELEAKTGLLNFSTFKELFEKKLIESKDMILVVIDIDHFKQLNDQYGHIFGDKVLKAISNVLKSNFRKSDLKGRYGGDELLLCLSNVTEEQAIIMLQSIIDQVNNMEIDGEKVLVDIDGTLFPCGISAGIVKCQYSTYEENFEKADQALYYSKFHGRNRVTAYSRIPEMVVSDFAKNGVENIIMFKIECMQKERYNERVYKKVLKKLIDTMAVAMPGIVFFFESVNSFIGIVPNTAINDVIKIYDLVRARQKLIGNKMIELNMYCMSYNDSQSYEENYMRLSKMQDADEKKLVKY